MFAVATARRAGSLALIVGGLAVGACTTGAPAGLTAAPATAGVPTAAPTIPPTTAPTVAPTPAATVAPTTPPTTAPSVAASAAPATAASATAAAPTAAPASAPAASSAGYGGGGGYGDYGPAGTPGGSAAGGATGGSSGSTALGSKAIAGVGTVLVGPAGLTLYTYANDSAGASTCNGGCSQAWPPLTATAAPAPPAGFSGKLTLIKRTDGSQQVAYDGHPLYMFSGDSAPGQANGQGSGGVWFVVTK